jgi:hypothetical protein
MSTAGIIGLGAIGGGVAICRARTGHLKAVHDMRDEQLVEIPLMMLFYAGAGDHDFQGHPSGAHECQSQQEDLKS